MKGWGAPDFGSALRRRALLLLVAAGLLAAVGGAPSRAQTPQGLAPPPGMTQEQMAQWIDAISTAVVAKLKKEEEAARPSARTAPATASDEGEDKVAAEFDRIRAQAFLVLGAIPQFFSELGRIPGLIDESAGGGRGPLAFASLALVCLGLALAAEASFRRLVRGTEVRIAGLVEGRHWIWSELGLICLDGLGFALLWAVGYGLISLVFPGHGPQARLAAALMSGVVFWRLYGLGFGIVFRPGLTKARLANLDDAGAARITSTLAIVLAALVGQRVLFTVLVAIHSPPEAIAAGQVLGSLGLFAVFFWAVRSARPAVSAWLGGLAAGSTQTGFGSALAQRWQYVAICLFSILCLAQLYGAIGERREVPSALRLTLNLLIALIVFETLLNFVNRRVFGKDGARGLSAGDVVARCLRVAAVILVGGIIAESWIVSVLGLVDASQWRSLTHAGVTAGIALFVAYVLWEIVHFWTDSYIANHSPTMLTGPAEEEGAVPPSATRLATIMPLVRIASVILIVVIASLVVLSELGVNITPLIAGASVFGLAVSFGSQTLVRDIVSGIFYLADDAFRVGEYIDCGKAKGTVEGFTLRSIRLRHQNGQVHTIPFGQLGQITNFSRDYTTMKFNLRFARSTDLEKLRKVTKKVGLAMLEEPEFHDEFLQPLKLQGVADVLENALVMRFKFTAKPNMPGYIQREAMKRLFQAFHEAGIEFASATVSVQTVGGAGPDSLAAAAAANAAATTAAAARPASTS
jgi:small-conductance mechanosensitive channel